jgi:hypothetical protein
MVDYKEKIINILHKNLTEKGFKLWSGINSILPDTWSKSTSSTGKYHKKLNGEIPTQAEHVYQMLYSAIRVIRLFNIEVNTTDTDKILLAIALHDSLKYGGLGNRKYSDNGHDRDAANMIAENKNIFLKIFTEEQYQILEEAVRFHSGRWSTECSKDPNFTFKHFNPETMFVHVLDMLSSEDCLKTDIDYESFDRDET